MFVFSFKSITFCVQAILFYCRTNMKTSDFVTVSNITENLNCTFRYFKKDELYILNAIAGSKILIKTVYWNRQLIMTVSTITFQVLASKDNPKGSSPATAWKTSKHTIKRKTGSQTLRIELVIMSTVIWNVKKSHMHNHYVAQSVYQSQQYIILSYL